VVFTLPLLQQAREGTRRIRSAGFAVGRACDDGGNGRVPIIAYSALFDISAIYDYDQPDPNICYASQRHDGAISSDGS
jgi:hypothetical protein